MINYRSRMKYYRLCITVLSCALAISIIFCLFLAFRSAKSPSAAEFSESKDDSISEIKSPSPQTDASSENTEENDELSEIIKKYGMTASSAFGFQAEQMSALLSLVTDPERPTCAHIDENGDANGIYTPAEVAFVYTDLTTGYTFAYNADTVMYSASLIKAPYVYAVLREIDEFEYNKLNFAADGSPLFSEDGKTLFEGKHPNLDDDGNIIYLDGEEKYDLSRIWVYDSETMYTYGSGVIQDEDDGFSLTYAELFTYALKYSDNVAFAQLIRTFGYESHNSMLEELDITGASKGFMQLSAGDCAVYLSEIYEYFNSDSKYASLMKDAMLSTDYTVMIPDVVAPTVCAHKYGWDVASYHDMAIVYDDRPFSLVIMTDLDRGRVEDYTYIQNIAQAVLDMHRAFGESEV